jgi:hypothetical protein
LYQSAWFILQIEEVEILSISIGGSGDTVYGGDVTIVNDSRIKFATTNDGRTIYGSFSTNEDSSLRLDWFSMDGSPYTGDTNTDIDIISEASNESIQIFKKYYQIDASQNTWLELLEVLVFSAEGGLIYQNYVSYGGQSIVVNSAMLVDAPVSIQVNEVYQVTSSTDSLSVDSSIDWDSSQYFGDNNVIGVTLNIRNNVRRVNSLVVRSSAVLVLGNTSEAIPSSIKIKTYSDIAAVGRRCGTTPIVQLRNGAQLVANIQKELKPQLVRDPGMLTSVER